MPDPLLTDAASQTTLQQVSSMSSEAIQTALGVVNAEGMNPKQAWDFLLPFTVATAPSFEVAAATVAADLHAAQRAARGLDEVLPYVPILAPVATEERWKSLMDWAWAPTTADPTATPDFDRIVAGWDRTISDAHRNTIIVNAREDPAVERWTRALEPGACDFCEMLAGRGRAYTAGSVRFKAHDHCRCAAASKWRSIDSSEMRAYRRSARAVRDEHLDAEYAALSAKRVADLSREEKARLNRLRRGGDGRVRRSRQQVNEYLAEVRHRKREAA